MEAEAKARNAKSRGRDGILGEGAASLLPTSLRVDDLSLCWPLKKASPTNKKCESLNGSSTIFIKWAPMQVLSGKRVTWVLYLA